MARQEAFSSRPAPDARSVQQRREAFELELRSYAGADPLGVWDRYVRWIRRAYPEGDPERGLGAVLERAVRCFAHERRYRDDGRYVNLWILWAQNCSKPLEMFSHLHAQGIGVKRAALYCAWAEALEKLGDLHKANAVYLDGLRSGATPQDELQTMYRAFQNRMSCKMSAPRIGEGPLLKSADLKPNEHKRALASVSRDGETMQGRSGSLDVFPSSSAPSSALAFEFLNQEGGKSDPSQVCVTADENNTMLQKQDEAESLIATVVGSHIQQLAPKSPAGAACQEDDHDRVQIMYCKDQLIKGPLEFSFEELRAERYFSQWRHQLQEKQLYLSKVKEDLRQQLEKMQKQNLQDDCSPTVCVQQQENEPFKVYNESEAASTPLAHTVSHKGADCSGVSAPPKSGPAVTEAKPFSIFEECATHDITSVPCAGFSRRKSLKLPPPILKLRASSANSPTEKEASDKSIQPEDAIVNGHCNQPLDQIPNDTYEFVHAATLASTPFCVVKGLGDGLGLTEDLRALTQNPVDGTRQTNPASVTEGKNLSPILEISQEGGFGSSVCQQSAGKPNAFLEPVTDVEMEPAAVPDKNPCSTDMRQGLLNKVDLNTLPNLHRVPGAMPSVDDWCFGNEMLFLNNLGSNGKYSILTSTDNLFFVAKILAQFRGISTFPLSFGLDSPQGSMAQSSMTADATCMMTVV
ncbi:mitotic checkpoint serine/threonine-protein kinase BUB1 beta-like isoform X2 [Denticeps clupeoides]|uniref:mitotic checkpoint serine/threonine-protein kinase BUB1 beta-like isoform X2 n=1 Tax=Denticeps clupeoides TaxID=299321 RepID=UPI0010A57BAF|nr:mitotic checkpoint serine/threonine-protein kinase BUB1 beta-like isoform X2 [Denticeps clupeoides]XP_028809130.1 mitotic checkpoint serine/threonine-protein kinase BUB1 beta-like isoform X2 [Denticeps clupeoides]